MKKYFLYELKKNAYVILSLTLIATAIYMVPILTNKIYGNYISPDETQLAVISTIGGLLAVIVPVWLLSYKMKKRSVDLYYALPLSRTKILTVKLLVGLIAIFVPYTVAYWLGAVAFIARFSSTFSFIRPVYYIPQYFISIPAILCIYALAAFAFTRANTMLDGIVFILFWGVILAAFCFMLDRFTYSVISFNHSVHQIVYPEYYLPFWPLNFSTVTYMDFITGRFDKYSIDAEYINMIVGFVLTGLMSIGAGVWLILTEKFAKAENAGQLSESWFGYRVMIPALTICLASVCELDNSTSILLLLLVAVGAFFLTALYRRTIKIGKKQAIIFGISLLIGILLAIINTRF